MPLNKEEKNKKTKPIQFQFKLSIWSKHFRLFVRTSQTWMKRYFRSVEVRFPVKTNIQEIETSSLLSNSFTAKYLGVSKVWERLQK